MMNIRKHTNPVRGERIQCRPDIAIRVKNGIAIMSGTVCSLAEKMRAEEAVYSMFGVMQVHNLVKTGP